MTARPLPYVWHLIGTMPSTNTRITATIGLMLGTGARVVITGWSPSWEWLGFLLISAGLDVAQFGTKRTTDSNYISAKASGEPPKQPEVGA